MKKSDKKELMRLRKISKTAFDKLQASNKHKHYKTEIEFFSYNELFNTIQDLLKLSINALYYNPKDSSPYIHHEPDIQLMLELILQLIPSKEGALLDEVRSFLEKKKR